MASYVHEIERYLWYANPPLTPSPQPNPLHVVLENSYLYYKDRRLKIAFLSKVEQNTQILPKILS